MTAAVTNPLKLTWGSFECGGTTEKLIVGVHRYHKDNTSAEVTLDIMIRGTSDATFKANCVEMETEFIKRRQKILFQVGTEELISLDHANGVNTGLNTYARIDKVGTPGADTDRSRLYTVTLGCELPATDTSGRRDSTVTVDYDPARIRTVTISGVWTALTAVQATAQYAAQIEGYCTTVLGALTPSATFERVAGPIGEQTSRDDQDKVIRWTRTFREVIANQPGGSPDSSSIVNPTFSIARLQAHPGDSRDGVVKRIEMLSLHFECALDKTQTTALKSTYENTIRPFIRTSFVSDYQPTAFAIESEQYNLARYTNTLSVDWTIKACIGTNELLEASETSRIVENNGVVLTGAWTGNIFDKYVDVGHATRRRLTIRTLLLFGKHAPIMRVPGSVRPPWVLIDNDSAATQITFGQPGGDQFTVTRLVEQIVEEYVTTPRESGPAITEPSRPADDSGGGSPTTPNGGSPSPTTPSSGGSSGTTSGSPSAPGPGGSRIDPGATPQGPFQSPGGSIFGRDGGPPHPWDRNPNVDL